MGTKITPAMLATQFEAAHQYEGEATFRFYRGKFWRWTAETGRYSGLTHEEGSDYVINWLRNTGMVQEPATAEQTVRFLQASLRVPSSVEMPCLLTNPDGQTRLAFANGLHPLEAVLAGTAGTQPQKLTPAWFSATRLPYVYDPTARCPQFLAWLTATMDGDAERIAAWQECCGYWLTPDTSRETAVFLYGPEGTGKTTLAKIAVAMLGPDNVSQTPMHKLADRFSLSATIGKTLNWSDEMGVLSPQAEYAFKWYVSGNPIDIEQKYMDPFPFRPTARLLTSLNAWPTFREGSGAIWRRILLIPMLHQIPREQQDPGIPGRLMEELPGIFNWAIEGLRRLNSVGHFTASRLAQHEIEMRRDYEQSWIRFVAECCRERSGAFVTIRDLGLIYRRWCFENAVQAGSVEQVKLVLLQRFPSVQVVRRRRGGLQVRGLEGVEIDP